ncbi:MAG: indolepyruvate ferredoxin oxidoreductase subunit alpha [Candidatus Jordarchaeum sp.]|uniref:indolepyruvate ferredoxin oxidoreductase subunit alpha n=1 Tax=Candidatus Jordarchaeum sp. TaxID=2823881 RepID=UPI00404B5163
MRIVIDEDKCTGCAFCLFECPLPEKGVKLVEGKAKIREDCDGCGKCVAVCTAGAIFIEQNSS